MAVLEVKKIEISNAFFELWTLNRPDKLNAINFEVIEALESEGIRARKQVESDAMSCRGIILCGAGDRAFAAGADIGALQKMSPAEAQAFGRKAQVAFGRLEEIPVPTIAAIHGFALGGGLEVAMCCDVLMATEKAQFGQPEGLLGLIPGFGAMARFTSRVGLNKGLELLCSGERIKASDALRLGLISEIVPESENLLERAKARIAQLSLTSSPPAIRAMKQIVLRARRRDFDQLLNEENEAFGKIFDTADAKEGIAAFLEKRSAKFVGR